jgi:hypothetical protein
MREGRTAKVAMTMMVTAKKMTKMRKKVRMVTVTMTMMTAEATTRSDTLHVFCRIRMWRVRMRKCERSAVMVESIAGLKREREMGIAQKKVGRKCCCEKRARMKDAPQHRRGDADGSAGSASLDGAGGDGVVNADGGIVGSGASDTNANDHSNEHEDEGGDGQKIST